MKLTDGRDGTSITLDNLSIQTVPEPAAAALGLLGFTVLLRRCRR
jgi:MYXO-CTERM domain-containing protein